MMDQGKFLAFIIAIGLSAAFFATVIYLMRKRSRPHRTMYDDALQLIVKQRLAIEDALYILMAYKNYYNCSESDRDYLKDAAKIALHAVIKKHGTHPRFDFLKDEVKYD